MEKLTFNNEQLEFLKFIVQDFEYNDDHERYMIEQIENKIYQAQENQALKLLSGMNWYIIQQSRELYNVWWGNQNLYNYL